MKVAPDPGGDTTAGPQDVLGSPKGSPKGSPTSASSVTALRGGPSRRNVLSWYQVCSIFAASAIPPVIVVVVFSLMGVGLELFNSIARAETNMMGNGVVLLAVAWSSLLFVFDADKCSPVFAAPLFGLLLVMAFVAAFLKSMGYPWGSPLLVLMLSPTSLLVMRRMPKWAVLGRRPFYRAVGCSTLTVAGLLFLAWLVWTYATDYTEDGAPWTRRTKATLIGDTKDVYDHVYGGRPLAYDADCGPDRVAPLEEKEKTKILSACKRAETIWFVIWMVPFASVVFNLLVAVFCFLESRFKLTDGKEVVRLMQHFLSLLVFLIMGMYVTIYAAGVSANLASAFMAVFAAAVLASIIYAYYEVEPEVLASAAQESRFAKNMLKVFKSDWFRALGVGSTNFLIPSLFVLDMLRQKVRKIKGTAHDKAARFTQSGQSFVDRLHAWNWNQIFTKVSIMGEIFALLVLGGKFTYVLFSWLNYDVLDGMDLVFIVIFVFVVGICMFMLPMVPGSAVYVFAGIVVGKQTQAKGSIGFWPGVVLASFLGLAAKLTACCGQYSIGYKLGQFVTVQKMIGVDTVPTRAIEKILMQKGLKPGKVGILVGGPDWPTSVTCGILKLNIPQMLLGTLPVYIASIAPQTLVGALLTRESDGNDSLWSTITTACTGVAAVCQAGSALIASKNILQCVEKDGDELAKPRPEHAKVAELTAKQADYVESFSMVESWGAMSVRRRATISTAACMHLAAFALFAADFVLMEPVCFSKFAVNDRIRETLNGNVLELVLLPLGALGLSIWFIACIIHILHSKDMGRLARAALSADLK